MRASPDESHDSLPEGGSSRADVRVGRGVLWLSISKLVFVAMGFVTQFGLPRVLATPEDYGLLSTAIALTVVLTNAMTASMVQATSKLVAGSAISPRPLAMRHAGLGVLVAAIVTSAAAPLATHLVSSPTLVPLLRLAAVVVVAYAVYATAIGALNGKQDFVRQARLDVAFSVLRTAGLLGGALALGRADGAMAGFALAAVGAALVGAAMASLHAAPARPLPPPSEHARLLAPLIAYHLALNALLQIDLEILAAGVAREAATAGQSTARAAEIAAREAGLYRAAQTLSFVPYQLVTSVTLVIFPVVARAASTGDDVSARITVREALRFCALLAVGLLAPLVGAPEAAVAVAFPDSYGAAAAALPALGAGQVAFIFGVVCATVLVGRGRLASALGAAIAGASVAACADFGAWWLAAGSLRVGTAVGTSTGGLVFAALAALALHRNFQALPRPASLLRALLAGLAGALATGAIPSHDRATALGRLMTGFFVYILVLVGTREVGRADLEALRGIAGRARPSAR